MADGGEGRFDIHLGSTGVPFLTRKKSVPLYKNEDPFYTKPQPMRRVRNDIFDLADEEQLKRYNKIWEGVGYGVVRVVDEDKHWDPETHCWKVFIRWFLSGSMDPGELRGERRRAFTNLYAGD